MNPDRHFAPSGVTEAEAQEGRVLQESVAIVGMACRFPGSRNLAEFWQNLVEERNLIVKGPPGSVNGRSGPLFRDYDSGNDAVRFGACIEDIELFDADFFHISPAEAQLLDPQQRLMLETSWAALEDAAIDPAGLRGSMTGVYAGISRYDYQELTVDAPETAEPANGLYAITGTSLNTAVGRVSYVLGLQGPNMAVDTACSSSLVAIHQALAGLQLREMDLVIAGGVHLSLSGRALELRANAGMASPEGQCKTFDAAADGYASGEGCGLVVLKRLGDAQADGDRIWAVLRGSAVNQDGASQGLTVPSGASQMRVMEAALARAGVAPAEMDYLEAHGTGTIVGDPIELNAAAGVYGRDRAADRPLLVGSVKTNIGHLAPAAGVAGLIKVVLSMQHGVIPRHLNFSTPNPGVDWARLPVRVTAEATDWPRRQQDRQTDRQTDRQPLASVNSFGWSGTNAHLVVEGYGEAGNGATFSGLSAPQGAARHVAIPTPAEGTPGARETRFLPLSARSGPALQELAARYLCWLDEQAERIAPQASATDPLLSDLTWTAAVGRSHFSTRTGIVFSDGAGLRASLAVLAESGAAAPGLTPHPPAKVAFVFTGQASQWVGMGQTLYAREPVFRSVLDRCDRLLTQARGVSLLDVMFGRGGPGDLLDEPAWTQPSIYALECALLALWASAGVRPAVVLGHSLGEIAAAQAAGVFTLEQGLRYAAARGELMGATRSDGAMAAVFAPVARVETVVAEYNAGTADAGLSIAAYNGMQQVLSGPEADIEAAQAILEAAGVKVARLKRSPAYHSALVEPALDRLEAAFRALVPAPSAPAIPLISNITGRLLDPGQRMDGAYWRRHARAPVAFQSSVDTLAELAVDAVVELGPHAVLAPMVSMIWPETAAAPAPVVLHSLQRPSREVEEPVVDTSGGFVEAVAGAYEAGLAVQFPALFAGEERRRIALPGYPFQRSRHWASPSKRRHQATGHALLGARQELPRGEVVYETELHASTPAWLADHLVYEQVVVPGGLYGAMAVCAALLDGDGPVVVDDAQFHNALILEDEDTDEGAHDTGRRVQLVLDAPDETRARNFEVFSKGETEEGWTLHATGKLSSDAPDLEARAPLDLDALRAELTPQDPAKFYEMRSADKIYLGPSYHTLKAAWARAGEGLGELVLQESVDAGGMALHPLLLDGCFQALSVARHLTGIEHNAVYMPFGWERLWVAGPMPERTICHALLDMPATGGEGKTSSTTPPEVVTGDMRFYSTDGNLIGGLSGFTVKRATQTALLAGREGFSKLLYEPEWRPAPLFGAGASADFLAEPAAVASQSRRFTGYLADEGVEALERLDLLRELERLSYGYVLAGLEQLGWSRQAGAPIQADELRSRLHVVDAHRRLFTRLLSLLGDAGILSRSGAGFIVEVGADTPLPEGVVPDPDAFASQLIARYPHAASELGLVQRCGSVLAGVLQGRVDPLPLLFVEDGSGAADLYRNAPASRAANVMLADAVAAAVAALPADRTLRVLEVGAGTGGTTASVLPGLLPGRFEYTFTDISAGFFAKADARFSATGATLDYQPLNIELDPVGQGFDAHGYDLVIAANVLHATRDLCESLRHCRGLLAPSGQLIALEGMERRPWRDLVFGLLEGWWRFDDAYRVDYALVTADVWRRVLDDAGFSDVAFLGGKEPGVSESLGSSVIIARGPAQVSHSPGVWVLAADAGGAAQRLAAELCAQNQTVMLAGAAATAATPATPALLTATVDPASRESWRALLEGLPGNAPLKGVVHLMALDGHGAAASAMEMKQDVTRTAASALALVQGLIDYGAAPTEGVWFITRGAQTLPRERPDVASTQLAGATLWGFGKVMSREARHLYPRMIDLEAASLGAPAACPVAEFLFPDPENHIAWRGGSRFAARLVRLDANNPRLAMPEDLEWSIQPADPEAGSLALRAAPLPRRELASGEVRVAVEAAGLNFADVFSSMHVIPDQMDWGIGLELCGRILETAPDVAGFAVGDRVVGVGFNAFTPEFVGRADLLAPAPAGFPAPALASMPICFVTAGLAFEFAGLKAGERALVHAGAGGVGLAAIQLARAAGVEVYATASAPKQGYLRSIGVEHVFDSRTTAFAQGILEATGGEGVQMVLNSLTGEGFIDASLSCLAPNGSFVELSKLNVWSAEEMAEARPDVAYQVLKVDEMKRSARVDASLLKADEMKQSVRVGDLLARMMNGLSAGKLTPIIPYTVWPLSELRSAMEVMRNALHVGKNVLRIPTLARGQLRGDGAYLVTGGMGGIGCEIARWLARHKAGTIVLNGRRAPDPAAEAVIRELREGGADVRVELADMTDPAAIDAMLARMQRELPPLAGVIHSVGVLSDGAIENQTWERFEQVLWPKALGAWRLHEATKDLELDLFILFSSAVGVIGRAGQSNHGAANAFLDQLAAHRRALGLPGQSIAWGAWSGIGEAEEQRERMEQYSDVGWFTPEQGMKAFDHLVRQDVTTPTVGNLFASAGATEDLAAFLGDLRLEASARKKKPKEAAPAAGLLRRLQEGAAQERQQILEAFVQEELQALLRLSSAPSTTAGFFDMGMDSLMAVELRNRIKRALGAGFKPSNTMVFDYPDITRLAGYLAAEIDRAGVAAASLKPSAPKTSTPKPPAAPRRAREGDDIAIVGMGCRFPDAPDLASFWRQLDAGETAVSDGRSDQGLWEGVLGDPGATTDLHRIGGFLNGLDRFDAAFFGIRPIEARKMDPQQRLLLETSWQALEDAAIDPARLRGSRGGVYFGIASSEYRGLMQNGLPHHSNKGFFGNMTGVAVGRVSFAYGMEGPVAPVELGCASSLVAMRQAVMDLRDGTTDLALSGGVNVILSAELTSHMAEYGILSRTGRCWSFDMAADGYVRGEGCGVVVLKRLADAEAAGDRIWGVIRGSATNQNGVSGGLLMPNGPAQRRVMEEALARAAVDPLQVDYLEAHANGSEMGDAIEAQAVSEAFGAGRAPDQPLLIGSVKANIGHLEAAAGVASLIKVVLSMNHGRIPRQINFNNPNPNIDWEELPLRVVSEAWDWPVTTDRPPRAGISAFSITGTNACLIVEGYEAAGTAPTTANGGAPSASPQPVTVALPDALGPAATQQSRRRRRTRMLPLSGKSGAALRELAGLYLAWLDAHNGAFASGENTPDGQDGLADLAWTAAVGRSHFAQRAAILFEDAGSLRAGLAALAEAGAATPAQPVGEVVFAYTGAGGHWSGLDAALYESEPALRAVLERCDEALLAERDGSLLELMFDPLDDPAWTYPASYALECALTTLWSNLGIQPGVVFGTGSGEIAAAHAAGVFTLEDGLRLAARRGASMAATADVALEGIVTARPARKLVNPATGQLLDPDDALDSARWNRQEREPAALDGCVRTLADLGVGLVVEVGARPALGPGTFSAWSQAASAGENGGASAPLPVVLASQEHGAGEAPWNGSRFLAAVARAYEAGVALSLEGLFAGETRRRIALPGYPFQRRRFWFDDA